jgi:hypothetical protein
MELLLLLWCHKNLEVCASIKVVCGGANNREASERASERASKRQCKRADDAKEGWQRGGRDRGRREEK